MLSRLKDSTPFVATADGVCAVDREQRIVHWNPAAESMLGYSQTEVRGRYCFDIFCGADEKGIRICKIDCPAITKVRTQKIVASRDVHTCTKSGRQIWLNMSTVALPAGWMDTVFLIHLFRDVSTFKQLRSGVERLLADFRIASEHENSVSPGASSDLSNAIELTQREGEVLSLLAAGTSTDQIAQTLEISNRTVRNHIHNIFAKFNVHSRIEAVTLALREGLL